MSGAHAGSITETMRWDDVTEFEVSGCHVLGEDVAGVETVEPCADACATFWTIYAHHAKAGAEVVADFNSRSEAHDVAVLLRRALRHFAVA